MFDSIFNFIIILIPLAIFIGRAVLRARSRRAPPPPPPRIPIHFEDDYYEDGDDYEGTDAYVEPAPRPVPVPLPKQAAPIATLFRETPFVIDKGDDFYKVLKTPSASGQIQAVRGNGLPGSGQNFPLDLKHLSPIMQAVVMAEVLGVPKGMSDWMN